MHCVRCQGLMIGTHFLDFEGGFGEMWATSWRCVNCGHIYDPTIERNRLIRQAPVLALPRCEPAEGDGEAFVRPAA